MNEHQKITRLLRELHAWQGRRKAKGMGQDKTLGECIEYLTRYRDSLQPTAEPDLLVKSGGV